MHLFPRTNDFFKMFERQVDEIQKAAKIFRDLEEEDNIKKQSIKIKKIEHAADEITHEIIRTLNTTFITPIDREDIASLASDLDDIVDVMDMAMSRLYVYHIETAPPELFTYTKMADKAIAELAKGVKAMGNRKRQNEVLKHAEFVNFIENESDDFHRKTLEKLFETEKDPILLIKMKEIYEILEQITDRCEDAANSLETIVVKNQ